jgi:hypothetical protein
MPLAFDQELATLASNIITFGLMLHGVKSKSNGSTPSTNLLTFSQNPFRHQPSNTSAIFCLVGDIAIRGSVSTYVLKWIAFVRYSLRGASLSYFSAMELE